MVAGTHGAEEDYSMNFGADQFEQSMDQQDSIGKQSEGKKVRINDTNLDKVVEQKVDKVLGILSKVLF